MPAKHNKSYNIVQSGQWKLENKGVGRDRSVALVPWWHGVVKECVNPDGNL